MTTTTPTPKPRIAPLSRACLRVRLEDAIREGDALYATHHRRRWFYGAGFCLSVLVIPLASPVIATGAAILASSLTAFFCMERELYKADRHAIQARIEDLYRQLDAEWCARTADNSGKKT